MGHPLSDQVRSTTRCTASLRYSAQVREVESAIRKLTGLIDGGAPCLSVVSGIGEHTQTMRDIAADLVECFSTNCAITAIVTTQDSRHSIVAANPLVDSMVRHSNHEAGGDLSMVSDAAERLLRL